MKFNTKIDLAPFPFQIDHKTKITCLGSCFAEHIGQKLNSNKMDIICNPTGIMYNPISLSQSILGTLNKQYINPKELFEQQGRWVNYNFHSELSSTNPLETSTNINKKIEVLHQQIIHSDLLILSLGTAFVFELKENNTIVNNCHKMPQELFNRRLLTLNEIKENLSDTFKKLNEINSKIKILLTISPVRHVRDGLIANNRSKAMLNIALHQLVDTYDNTFYFPAYEIMMDDLRDYRFYNKDLIHPSDQAIDYIWELFSSHFFSTSTNTINNQIAKINTAIHHRPFNPNSEEHQKFKKIQKEKILQLQKQYPHLNLEEELLFFSK